MQTLAQGYILGLAVALLYAVTMAAWTVYGRYWWRRVRSWLYDAELTVTTNPALEP